VRFAADGRHSHEHRSRPADYPERCGKWRSGVSGIRPLRIRTPFGPNTNNKMLD
jgi:hypothetical protein